MGKSLGLAVLALVLGSVLAAGSASAASRGFELENASGIDIVLEQPQRITEPPRCTTCEQRLIPMAFEGRPADGATLPFRKIHDWELDYYFGSHWHIPQYAAELVYEIPAEQGFAKALVIYRIYTYILENESTCELFGPRKTIARYGCKAEGLQLEFTGPGVGARPQGEDPQTVADFHALPRNERRGFALDFMTTHKVDPCSEGKAPLSHEEAVGFLDLVDSTVKPGTRRPRRWVDARRLPDRRRDPAGARRRGLQLRPGHLSRRICPGTNCASPDFRKPGTRLELVTPSLP